jgi:xylulokinase
MYIGVDCGTQGTKVVLLDTHKAHVVGEGYAPHDLISDANGRREQHPSDWVSAFIRAFEQCVAQSGCNPKEIRGIGVSGQQHGLVVLDAKGDVIRPAKLWCDTETAPENAWLLEQIGGEQGSIELLGLPIATGYTVSKLVWLKQHDPESFVKIAHILLPHDYLNYWLTGELVAEKGDASGTGFFDVRTRTWQTAVFDRFDAASLADALPPLIEAEASAGFVQADVAKQLGLGSDVIVSSGGGDNMMGAIGTGNICDGKVTMSLGTSGTLYAYSSEAPKPMHSAVAPFCSSTNGWLPLICTMNLTGVVNQVRGLFGYDLDAFDRAIKASSIGASGITMLPFLSGERVPALPNATGNLTGINPQNMTPENLCRAAIEGVSYTLRYGLDRLGEGGISAETICLIGGGSKSAFWRQLMADLCNAKVVCPETEEAAALGAAIQAVWCDQHAQGQAASLNDLCDQFVHLNPAKSAVPSLAANQEYEQAYQRYLDQLRTQYPNALN